MSGLDVQCLQVAPLFGVKNHQTVAGYKEPTQGVPEKDPDYIFEDGLLAGLLVWWATRRIAGANDGLVLTGHTGCGKSTVAEQFANRLNVPVWAVICSGRTEPEDIFGTTGLAGGNTYLAKGPAVKAAEAGGILLLEEGDRLDPTVMGLIAPMLEGKPFRVPGDGRLIKPAGLFGVIMTTNTRSGEDETGLYVSNKAQNMATMSRFQAIEVDYLREDLEMALLEKKIISRLPDTEKEPARALMDSYIKVTTKVRDAFREGEAGLTTVISTRVLQRWAAIGLALHRVAGCEDPDIRALDQALLANASADTQAAIHDMVDAVCG